MTARPETIASTLAALKEAGDRDRMSVEDVLQAFGRRAYGPVFFSLGVIALSPIGAIPGASIVCATLVILLAVQMGLRHGPPWVPRRLTRIDVDAARARSGIARVEPWLGKLDAVTRPRWPELVDGPVIYVVVLALCALSLLMFPLALVPWGVMPVAFAIAVLGLGLLGRDGVMTLVGLGASVLADAAGGYLLTMA